MMARLFPSGHATHPQWRMAAALVLAQLRAQMAAPGYARAPALGLVYITDHFADDAAALLEFLSQQLPEVQAWSGTAGIGVVANNAEYFDEPSLSVMLCDIPPEQWRVFSGVAPMPKAGLDSFVVRTALVHADRSTPDLVEVLEEMAQRTGSGRMFGGLTASRGAKVQFALDLQGDANLSAAPADNGVFEGGLSGVAFGPEVQWVSRVTQACKPIAPWAVVTAVRDNLVLELDGVPALDMLLDTLGVTLEGDTQPAIQAVNSTMAGLLDAGSQPAQYSGQLDAQTRVRGILGLDTTHRGVALTESVSVGSLLAFCQHDRNAARADLMRICAELREELEPAEDVLPVHGSTNVEGAAAYERMSTSRCMLGAVYVSCVGRGGEFFGGPSAELQIVRRALGDVPLAGFFAYGEISDSRLFSYTGVLTVFVGGAAAGA